MAKKKRPAPKNPQVPAPQKIAVNRGDVFAAFVQEAQSIGNEVTARRVLQAEIGVFLAEKGLAEEFEAWRAARAQPAT